MAEKFTRINQIVFDGIGDIVVARQSSIASFVEVLESRDFDIDIISIALQDLHYNKVYRLPCTDGHRESLFTYREYEVI